MVYSPSGITTPPPVGTFTTAGTDVLDMPVDPNEPTYCLCHQVCVCVYMCVRVHVCVRTVFVCIVMLFLYACTLVRRFSCVVEFNTVM